MFSSSLAPTQIHGLILMPILSDGNLAAGAKKRRRWFKKPIRFFSTNRLLLSTFVQAKDVREYRWKLSSVIDATWYCLLAASQFGPMLAAFRALKKYLALMLLTQLQ